MKAIMEAVGFEPVFDPVAYHTTFYPREQAMGLDLDAVDPDDVVVVRRTRAEAIEHRRRAAAATKDVRSAVEVLRDVEKARAVDSAHEDLATGRQWTRQGRSRRLKGEIGRRRVPSRRWVAERH